MPKFKSKLKYLVFYTVTTSLTLIVIVFFSLLYKFCQIWNLLAFNQREIFNKKIVGLCFLNRLQFFVCVKEINFFISMLVLLCFVQGKDDHDWYCFECHGPGEMVLCSECFRAYHTACAKEDHSGAKFTCSVCKVA